MNSVLEVSRARFTDVSAGSSGRYPNGQGKCARLRRLSYVVSTTPSERSVQVTSAQNHPTAVLSVCRFLCFT
jgi:hypothetical protein